MTLLSIRRTQLNAEVVTLGFEPAGALVLVTAVVPAATVVVCITIVSHCRRLDDNEFEIFLACGLSVWPHIEDLIAVAVALAIEGGVVVV